MDKPANTGILEEFRLEFLDCWQRLPNKGLFFILLVGWLEAPKGKLSWEPSEQVARTRAATERRPMLVDFTAEWCGACKELSRITFSDPTVMVEARRFPARNAADPKRVEAADPYQVCGGGGGEEAEGADAGEHQEPADDAAQHGDGEDVTVPDCRDRDDRPPDGVAEAVDVLVGSNFGEVETGGARQDDDRDHAEDVGDVRPLNG